MGWGRGRINSRPTPGDRGRVNRMLTLGDRGRVNSMHTLGDRGRINSMLTLGDRGRVNSMLTLGDRGRGNCIHVAQSVHKEKSGVSKAITSITYSRTSSHWQSCFTIRFCYLLSRSLLH